MRSIIAAGFVAAFTVAAMPAFAECSGHVKQQSVQAPSTSTTTATETTTPAKPKG